MKAKMHALVIFIACIIGIVVLNVGFLFVLLGFLPTVLAFIVDESESKNLYKTVRATNIIGMLPIMINLGGSEYAAAVLQIKMNHFDTWIMVYGCAFAGWALIGLCYFFSYMSTIATSEARIMMLEETRRELTDEWGEDIKEYTVTTR